MKNTIVKALSFLMIALFITGCTGSNEPDTENTVNEKGQTTAFEKFKTDRPEAEAASIGVKSADLIFSGISGIYVKTTDVTDKFINRVENNQVALSLEEIRKANGEEAYNQALSELSGVDKEMYEKFLASESNSLEVVKGYLAEALKLQVGISNINVNELVTNPFSLPGAIKNTKLATEQIGFTVDALKMLKSFKDGADAQLENKSR